MAFHILHTLKHGADLPPEVVNYMYASGAFIILKDFPEGHEFGIDYKSWTVGPKFMGLKMIPAGVHFVYCSVKGAPRIGKSSIPLLNANHKIFGLLFYFFLPVLLFDTNFDCLLRLNPLKGKISAQAELVSMETCLMENEEFWILKLLQLNSIRSIPRSKILQVFEGFEQWKRFIHLLCCCPSALGPRSD
ncbi:unnamed protein product, partial [Strongylus vulgaris]